MRALWAAAFLLRRLRAEPGVVLMVVTLVGVTAFLFAAAPRLLNAAADEGLRQQMETARALERNVQISLVGPAPSGGDPLQRIGVQGAAFRDRMPPTLERLVHESTVSVESIRFVVTDAPDRTYLNTFVNLRHQDGLQEVMEVVEGRLPERLGQALPQPVFGFVPEDYEPPEELPRFEIVLSDRAAADAGLGLGDVIGVQADGNDPMLPRAFAVPLPAEFEVVGIFTVTDPGAEVWYDDRSLQVLDLGGSDDNPLAFVTALIDPEALRDLTASGLPFSVDWRYFVDAEALDADDIQTLIADVQRMAAGFITSSTVSTSGGRPVLRTALPELLREYVAAASATQATLTVAGIGPLVLAGAAVGMVGVLLVNRRRAPLALTRGRGASWRLLLGAQLWEAVLLAGVAAIAGYVAAVALVPGRASPASGPLVLAVALGAVVALVAANWPATRRPLRELHADEVPVVRPSPRRLVLEGTAVLVALGGIFLLRQRGLAVEEGQVTSADPLLAATPALAGLAVGIVAMRLYPLPIRALGWLAAHRRDLVPVLGLRTVGRHPAAANLPLLVLMLTAAFGAFASVATSTIDRGQLVASWENFGADFRIERIGGGSVDRVPAGEVEGVEAVAGAYVDGAATFASTPNQRSSILFYALDADAYPQVTAGAPIDPALPPALLGTDEPALGTPESPIPAILSRRLPPASDPVQPGDTFTVEVAGQQMTFVDVQERTEFPALRPGSTFVIAPLDQVQQAYRNRTLTPNLLLVRGPASAEGPLRDAMRDSIALGQLGSRHAAYESLRDAPLVSAVVVGFAAALAVSAGYTALTVMAALSLSASSRTRDLAFLRTLGLSARQSLQLTVMEHAPPVLIALVPGVVLGVAVAVLLVPALDLGAFAASERELGITIDWAGVAAVSGLLLLVVAVAIALSTWLSRRARAADALRIGDD